MFEGLFYCQMWFGNSTVEDEEMRTPEVLRFSKVQIEASEGRYVGLLTTECAGIAAGSSTARRDVCAQMKCVAVCEGESIPQRRDNQQLSCWFDTCE